MSHLGVLSRLDSLLLEFCSHYQPSQANDWTSQSSGGIQLSCLLRGCCEEAVFLRDVIIKHSKSSVTLRKHSVESQEEMMIMANAANKSSWTPWQGSLKTLQAAGDQHKASTMSR